MTEQTYTIAGHKVCIKFHEDEDTSLLPSFAPFKDKDAETGECLLNVEVGKGLSSATPSGEEVGQFDCGGNNHGVYKIEGGYQFLISNIYGKLCVSLTTGNDFRDCRASLLAEDSADRSFGLNNAMMIAFAFSSAIRNTFLMHSSVIINAGKGYMFLGKSGTGKSTHSKLWYRYIKGSDLLNDDNPAVRYFPETGKAVVFGTPWSGKTPCYRNLHVEIGAIVRLEQYPENIIAIEPKVKAFASILSSCSTMIWDKKTYDGICNTASAVASATRVFYLKCRPDEEAARLSFNTIAK